MSEQENKAEGQMEPTPTVDEIADQIIDMLDSEERKRLRAFPDKGIEVLQLALGMYTKPQLDKFYIDEKSQNLDNPYASANIIQTVFEKLRNTPTT